MIAFRCISVGLVALLTFGAAIRAQVPQSFEVASVKPSPPERPRFPFRDGPTTFSMQARLRDLVQYAYELEHYQIAGGPEWAQEDWYQVEAKTSAPAEPAQIRVMLQRLLAERFHLTVHRETRMMPGYVLSVDKGGPKLPPARIDVPPESKGSVQLGGGLWARGSTMRVFATGLSYQLEQPVLDQTGIAGHYDFRLRFDDVSPDIAGKPASGAAPSLGSVFTAVHEIGLKLEAKKIPVEMVVIDDAARPSEN